uniref:Uncharacterized protein n=1 Tax=Rhizophora mucronata TaxID=61149 RepID=A0A2P2NLM6_RHIMU
MTFATHNSPLTAATASTPIASSSASPTSRHSAMLLRTSSTSTTPTKKSWSPSEDSTWSKKVTTHCCWTIDWGCRCSAAGTFITGC